MGVRFFDKCLSIHNRMAESSKLPPKIKVAALIFSKPSEMSMIKDCCTTAFSFAVVQQFFKLFY